MTENLIFSKLVRPDTRLIIIVKCKVNRKFFKVTIFFIFYNSLFFNIILLLIFRWEYCFKLICLIVICNHVKLKKLHGSIQSKSEPIGKKLQNYSKLEQGSFKLKCNRCSSTPQNRATNFNMFHGIPVFFFFL